MNSGFLVSLVKIYALTGILQSNKPIEKSLLIATLFLSSSASLVRLPYSTFVEEWPPKSLFSQIRIGRAETNSSGLSSRHKSKVASEGFDSWYEYIFTMEPLSKGIPLFKPKLMGSALMLGISPSMTRYSYQVSFTFCSSALLKICLRTSVKPMFPSPSAKSLFLLEIIIW